MSAYMMGLSYAETKSTKLAKLGADVAAHDDGVDHPIAVEMEICERKAVTEALDISLNSEIGCSPKKILKRATEDTSYIERKAMKLYHELRNKP